MKKIFLTLMLVSTSVLLTVNSAPKSSKEITIYSDFCEGFEDGFCEGFKNVRGQFAICPIAPICPIPPIDQNTYRGGYNMGFITGRRKANQ